MAAKQWGDLNNKEKKRGLVAFGLFILAGIVFLAVLTSGGGSTDDQRTVDVTKSEEVQIEQIIRNSLPEQNSNSQSYVRSVKVAKQAAGSYSIDSEYNAENFKKVLIDQEMSIIYKALYTSGKDIGSVSIAAYSELIDENGNNAEQVVYKTILDKEAADKINFNADRATLEASILPGAWRTALLHSGLQASN